MLGSSDLIGFVPAINLDEARDFYAETLGLRLVEQNPAACVFDANGTMLRVTAVGDFTPAPFTIAGWAVTDIATAVKALGEQSVAFKRFDGMDQDDLGIWTAPGGDLVAWFADPAGNTLSLTQFR